ncbi:MAG: methylenetetrahydrofolate--tRNA-(uracil(54)-C(5))-methyltransferase (FADH(2)-oxidizing) TrmFO [Bacillota bacterium]|jgi:methylenetetrahydrofolate--tRNA-(uracil-5-)-methyltransferase
MSQLIVVGAGLAGSEAAWQAAKRGVKVQLWEMRPQKMTPAHQTGFFAELVCSNSFRSRSLENAVGLLKEEMKLLDSLIMECAWNNQVPAGGALAVDRLAFAREVTEVLTNHPLIQVRTAELEEIPQGLPVIIATGPLTAGGLASGIRALLGQEYFYFYDAVAPIVTADSIDYSVVFTASRYQKGEAAYLNCPFDKEQYDRFYQALITAERHPLKEFEREAYFEGCLPVEVLAQRGKDTLRFGPMKPVGLIDPATGKEPYAVVQLRKDNREGTLYNLVGFQTNLKWGEQNRVFRLIPGLEKAEFARYGVMHRNSFINSPALLWKTNQLRNNPSVFFAGQITGVEGYVESAASGLVAGINAVRFIQGAGQLEFPVETAIGALHHYISEGTPAEAFQPMNINFGLLPPLKQKIRKKRERNMLLAQRSLGVLKSFVNINNI